MRDLYYVLKKRKVSLSEWLSYHKILTLEDFYKRAEFIANDTSCTISEEMRRDVEKILVAVNVTTEFPSNTNDLDNSELVSVKKRNKSTKKV